MPRQNQQPLIRKGQLPQPPEGLRILRPRTPDSLEDIVLWRNDLTTYLVRLVNAIENVRQPFAVKAGMELTTDQATTPVLAAVSWHSELYDNGGVWRAGDPTQLNAVLGGVYAGVFQTRLSGSGSIRVQLAVNNVDVVYGANVELAGDYTFAFPWQAYYNEGDYIEVKVSTSDSRNMLADWTSVHFAHLDFLEEIV